MTPRQFAFVALSLGAGLLAASLARPGNWEAAPGWPPEPVKATVATLIEPVATFIEPLAAKPQQTIRVILPSPYEER